MPNFKHILFPVDFSERCNATAPAVAALAKRFGAKVTLLNAVQPFVYAPVPEAAPVFVETNQIRQGIEEGLSRLFVEELAGITVERVVEVGDPAVIITRFAEETEADLIMMPSHGYGPFRRLLLGSVAAKVLHDSLRPVWTTAHAEEGPSPEHRVPQHILCAVETTPDCVDLLRSAAAFAQETGADLRLVHVLPPTSAAPELMFDAEFDETLRRAAREEIGKMQASAGVHASLCVKSGDVATAIREEAEKHGADLIVIGRGVERQTLGSLRTNAHAIIRHAPCPVLSV